MKKIQAVLIGAGNRGMDAYAPYALERPEELEFTAVAEPDEKRRTAFLLQYGIPPERGFRSWEELLSEPVLGDCALICTQDDLHYKPTLAALKAGYHVLLEKPISNQLDECVRMAEEADKRERAVIIAHVLRYTEFFRKIKELLDAGEIGRLMSIQHNENVGYWHYVHSFVRGHWKDSEKSSPMILAKSCHDMDIMLWLAGADCRKVSSFGTLSFFKPENAPEGAPDYCLDGCPEEESCVFHPSRVYAHAGAEVLAGTVTGDALRYGPYGKCAFRSDNNVVDHQVVILEFENEVTAAFTMSAFTEECTRTIKLMGTKGEIRGHMEKNEIELVRFKDSESVRFRLEAPPEGHGGGDYNIMKDFVEVVASDGKMMSPTSIDQSLQSHVMAFAAEASRVEGRTIELKSFVQGLRR